MARITLEQPKSRIQVLGATPAPTPQPFDNTALGIAKNTVIGLPQAAVDVAKGIGGFAKDVGQGIARTVGSVGITAGNLPTQIVNTGLAEKQPLPFDQSIPTAGTPYGDFLFGGKPIETLQQQAKGAKEFTQPYIGSRASSLFAYPLVGAGVALDLAGLGGAAEKTGLKTAEQVFKHFAEEKSPAVIADTLTKMKAPAEAVPALAERLAKATTPQGVKDILTGAKVSIPPLEKVAAETGAKAAETVATEKLAQEAAPAAGPGYQKFTRYLDSLVSSETIHKEDANILKTIFEGTNDDYLKGINFGTNARFRNTFGRTSTRKFAGEVVSQEIQLKRGLAAENIVKGRTPDFHPSVVLLHEYGHAAHAAVLNNEERALVRQAFNSTSKTGNRALFQSGLAGAKGNANYYAKNEKEFLAQSFAEYVMQNKVPAEAMKPLLQRMAEHFYEGLKRLVTRGDTHAVNRLQPVFDKMLAGDKTTPLSDFLAREPQSFRQQLAEMLSQRGVPKGVPAGETPPQFEGPVPSAGAAGKAAEVARELPPGSLPPTSYVDAGEKTLKQFTPYDKRIGWFDRFANTPEFVLQRIGLGKEAKVIRDSYDKYLAELKPNSDKILGWSKRVTPEGNAKIFRFLDGQGGVLTPEEAKVAEEVKAWLGEWADRLKIPHEGRIGNYITHIFPKGPGGEIPEEIARLIQGKQPGSVYDPFLLKRSGVEGFREDTWAALDAYTKTAARKVNMDPALDSLKKAAAGLSNDSQAAYVSEYAQLINMRPSVLDTAIENDIKKVADWGNKTFNTQLFSGALQARPGRAALASARSLVSAAKLGFSFVSAFKNLTQGVNTFAELGVKYTTAGYLDMVRNGARELEEVGVLNLPFIEDRNISALKSFWQKFDKVTFYNFELTERINRGAAYYGAKAKAIAEGATEEEARLYGKEIARKTQFQFGSVDTPIGMQSEIAKTLLQFQTYNVKQIEFVRNMVAKGEWSSLGRYMGASAVVYGTIGGAFGMSIYNMLPSVNLFGKTPPAFDIAQKTYDAAMGTKDQYGKTPSPMARVRNFENAVLTDLVPGGTQINRTIGGLGAVSRGASFTNPSEANPQGLFQYKIAQTPLNYVRGTLFGKSSLPEAKAYAKKKAGGTRIKSTGSRIQVL